MNYVYTEYMEIMRSVILLIIKDKNMKSVFNVHIVRTHMIFLFAELISTLVTLGGVTLHMNSLLRIPTILYNGNVSVGLYF